MPNPTLHYDPTGNAVLTHGKETLIVSINHDTDGTTTGYTFEETWLGDTVYAGEDTTLNTLPSLIQNWTAALAPEVSA